jgi:hypothetical protein
MSLSQQGPRGLRCAEAFDKSQLFRGPNKLRTGQLGCPGGGRAADPFFPLQKTNTVFPGHVTHGRTLDFLPLARLEEKQEGRTGPAGPCALLGQSLLPQSWELQFSPARSGLLLVQVLLALVPGHPAFYVSLPNLPAGPSWGRGGSPTDMSFLLGTLEDTV